MGKHTKPNLRIPLIPSVHAKHVYNDIFNLDATQVMKNMYHEVVKNELGGDTTVNLCRRPGWELNYLGWGSANTIPSVLFPEPTGLVSGGTSFTWGLARNGSAQIALDGTTETTLFTDINFKPAYVTLANINGAATAIAQFRRGFTYSQRVFFGSAIGSWTEITDAVFAALIHRGKMEFIDAHAFVLADDRNIYNCKVNDLTTWPAGNLIPKSIQLDVPAGLMAHGNTLIAFGTESAEGYITDSTNNPAGTVLSRRKDLVFGVGLGGGTGMTSSANYVRYYARVGDWTYFVGRSNATGLGIGNSLWAFNGSRFERVSPPGIDRAISETHPYGVHPFSFFGRQCIALQMTAPDASGTQAWWVFDTELRQWYYWTSTIFMPVSDGSRYAGASGNREGLYGPSTTTRFADGLSAAHVYEAYVQFDIPNDTNEELRMAWYGLDAQTDLSTNTCTVSFSDNDLHTSFVTRGTIDMQSKKKRLYRGGRFSRRTVRIAQSLDRPWRLREFQARVIP